MGVVYDDIDLRGVLSPNAPPYSASAKKFDPLWPNGDRPPPIVPELMFSSDFNAGTIDPFAIKGTDSVAIDNVHTFEGENTLRFNLHAPAITDPFTGKPSNNNPLNFSVAFKTDNECRSWPQMFVSYYVRMDHADNRDINGMPTNFKMFYVSDTFNESTGETITTTNSAPFPTMSVRGKCGVTSLARNGNSAGRFDPCPEWPAGAIQTGEVDRGFAFDGNWNKIEVLFDNVNHTMTIWFNGVKVRANSTQLPYILAWDGDMHVDPNFRPDHISLFHADAEEWANSTDLTGIRGGGNLARFRCYKGNPKAWGM